MIYSYAPNSAAAHYRAAALFGPAPAPTHVPLEQLEVPIAEAPKLASDVVAAGGWARCVRALAEDLTTCELVESVSVRVRLERAGIPFAGYAMWTFGRAAGASLWIPFRKRLTHDGLKIALGLLEVAYGNCDHWRVPWANACGARDVRLKADGQLRAHKTMKGLKCW